MPQDFVDILLGLAEIVASCNVHTTKQTSMEGPTTIVPSSVRFIVDIPNLQCYAISLPRLGHQLGYVSIDGYWDGHGHGTLPFHD